MPTSKPKWLPLLASPLAEVTAAHTFMREWYALWKDEHRQRRTVAEARARYEAWRSNPTYLALPALRRTLTRMTDAHFERLSAFLQQPHWEATNNGAERGARAFRHRQAPHFNLRSPDAIAGALVAAQCLRKAAATDVTHKEASRSTCGRKPAGLADLRS